MLSGALLYAVYNTRTIYQFAVVGVLLIIFVWRKAGRQKGRLITSNDFAIMAIIAGFFLASIPQVMSNYYHTGGFDLAPQTTQWRGTAGREISLFQLQAGLELNFVLPTPVHLFPNNAGNMMLQAATGTDEPFLTSVREYLQVVRTFPIEALGTYVRSLAVSLNPIAGAGSNIRDWRHGNIRFVYTLFNYTALFILFGFLKRAVFDHKFQALRQGLDRERLTSLFCLLAILLPFVFILPGAIEERFAVGFWLIVYGILLYCVDFRQEWERAKSGPWTYAAAYLAGFGVFIGILTEIYANNNQGVFLPILNLQ